MGREVKLNRLESALDDLDYPVSRDTAVAATEDVTLVLVDGESNLGEVIATASDESFDSVDNLASEVRGLLPRRAVGEPYQSEGEG